MWWKFISQNCSKRAHKSAEGLPKAELTVGTLYGDTNRKTVSFARTKALNNLEFCRCASDEIYTDDGAKIFIYLISEYWMMVHYLKHFHCCQAFYTTFIQALWTQIRDLGMWLQIRPYFFMQIKKGRIRWSDLEDNFRWGRKVPQHSFFRLPLFLATWVHQRGGFPELKH